MGIPIVDFSKVNGNERANTLALIDHYCQEWGFFQLINHGISEELLDRVKKVATECYKLEREAGFKNSKPVQLLNDLIEKNNDAKIENVDWEDVFLLSDENDEEWPSKTIGFKETMKEYRVELKKLGHKVMEIMDENLGLPKGYIKNAFDGGVDNTAFFGTKGLQMLKDGVWTDVQPLKNAIVINTGDQIEVLSNGRYKSILHRVVPQTDGQRRSIASFYNPSLKATIQPAPQLLDAKVENKVRDVAKYPKFVFGDYMSVYLEQKFQPKEPRFQAVAAI
ncbi:UNVERIFIED_CONTAM: 1-aminocyclopropane-1-carboxylate oxidase 5 [Sesamum latifolium]|uniref:1-aminocyclopropane-1-carboxylate oxidase 5 n=1 Tax=Sesamum latifolium TaxID=2727402 RepID=A0AAW2VF34_9LAMI